MVSLIFFSYYFSEAMSLSLFSASTFCSAVNMISK